MIESNVTKEEIKELSKRAGVSLAEAKRSLCWKAVRGTMALVDDYLRSGNTNEAVRLQNEVISFMLKELDPTWLNKRNIDYMN